MSSTLLQGEGLSCLLVYSLWGQVWRKIGSSVVDNLLSVDSGREWDSDFCVAPPRSIMKLLKGATSSFPNFLVRLNSLITSGELSERLPQVTIHLGCPKIQLGNAEAKSAKRKWGCPKMREVYTKHIIRNQKSCLKTESINSTERW